MSRRRPGDVGPRRVNPVVQLSGLVRKELLEVVRQPRLLVVMVLGPFIVLFLFAAGFDSQQTVLRTMFVGPADGPYEESIEEFADELSRYVDNAGYTSDLVAASESLDAGDVDLVVVLPADPVESILEGDQATIGVLHDKIDPIAQTTVEVSAQVAVHELNATILETVIGQTQSALVPYTDSVDSASSLIDDLSDAITAADDDAVAESLTQLVSAGEALTTISNVSAEIAAEAGAADDVRRDLDALVAATADFEQRAADLSERAADVDAADIAGLSELLDVVSARGDDVTTLEPRVIVRPFVSDTESLQRESVGVESFFAPAAVALLVQHMVLTFAAMSLVSDRTIGLFEIFRVGPIGSGRVLLGKVISFTLIGGVVTTALFGILRYALDVPFRGAIGWLIAGSGLLLLSSIGLGMLISLVAHSDTQAIQYALLALLAGLFFSGFFIDLDAFRYPFKAIAWLLPVTYGTNIFRDVMLRGDDPAIADLTGVLATTIGYGVVSWALLHRRLKVS